MGKFMARAVICRIAAVLAIASLHDQGGLRGQGPSSVRFTLAAKNGKTSFRLGEAVEVEFRFEAPTPGQYGVWTTWPFRQVRQPEYDHFTIEPPNGGLAKDDPADSVADPLADMFTQLSGGAIVGRFPTPTPLAGAPVIVGLQVNEWLSIRKPGHYRINALTTRVVTAAEPHAPVPLRSNDIEIDVVAPEAGWADAQLRQAVAVLEIPDPPPARVGQSINPNVRESQQADAAAAARTLRFLETPEAAQALARFFEHGPEYAQSELRTGLFASPYRKEVMAAMEAAVAAPDFPVTYYYLDALIQLAELTRFGPVPLYTAKGTEEIRRWIDEVDRPYQEKAKPVVAEYFTRLASSIATKQGAALAVTLQTLVTNGPQPTPPAAAKALAANFRQLPENSQNTLLTINWAKIASPDLAPVVQSIAEGNGNLRDAALIRLQDLDPGAARKITLDRIQKTDTSREIFHSNRVLLTLPDRTLPEADDALVTALERNKPQVETLVARYASSAALPRLKALVDRQPQRMCSPVLPAYFFRVDAEWAATALARAREATQGRGACAINVSPNEDLLMSPGLEKQAIQDLSDPNAMVVRSAQTLLQYAGSAAAEKPLLAAFAGLRATGVNQADPLSNSLDQGFVTAILSANGWLPSEAAFTQVLAGCITDQCKRQVESARRPLTPPIGVSIGSQIPDGSNIGLGPLGPRSVKQFREKIAQFPKGTPFYIGGNDTGSWFFQQHAAEAQKMLEDAGMQIVAPPVPATR
jgi:hypothetical protein